jgi:6-phosphofructokinase 1
MAQAGTLAILVGGGPAPGINAVISAAAIEAVNHGFEVLGIQDGFKWLVRRDLTRVRRLAIADVSRIHTEGGSILGTSRENPTKAPERLSAVCDSLQALGVTHLITVGGDDTAYSSSAVSAHSGGTIRTVHVPKTIDNDLPLPPQVPTFGFQTARHLGVELVQNLLEDAHSTGRWYVVVAMGRKAGHLALGVGKGAGATVTLIGEEFEGERISFHQICDVVEGTIIKTRALNRHYGVAVLAEGLIEKLDAEEIGDLKGIERDDHGHIRLAEVDLGQLVKAELQHRFATRNVKIHISSKTLGYELRCAPPIPFDAEYCRDLGYSAVRYLLEGGSGAMVTIQGGKLVPMSFADVADPRTGHPRIRLVDTSSAGYQVARRYMVRLDKSDFVRPEWLARLASAGGMGPAQFRERFSAIGGGAS